jgi:uncharacterized membrane protein
MTFAEAADASLGTFRHYARSSPVVLVGLLETIARVAERVSDDEDLEVLRRHALLVEREGRDALAACADLARFETAHLETVNVLARRSASGVERSA